MKVERKRDEELGEEKKNVTDILLGEKTSWEKGQGRSASGN